MQQTRIAPELEEELFGESARARQEPDQVWWVWPVYLGLFALSVPWYLPVDTSPPIWFGLPYWVVLSLGTTMATVVFTRFVVRRFWSVVQPPASPAQGKGTTT